MEETDIKELDNEEHEVLGSDFCSGYTDIFGKWNTGFDCPRAGNGKIVYCCGTVTYKYCCTRRDHHNTSGISQSVILGSALGSVLVIALVTLISCLICRRCMPYRRGHPSLNGGPLYTMHCSSTASGMANVYTFSGQTPTVTTPLDASHVLIDLNAAERGFTTQNNPPRGMTRLLARATGAECAAMHPSEPPPPYNEECPAASSSERNPSTCNEPINLALHDTSAGGIIQQRSSTNQQRRSPNDDTAPASPQNRLYWSTKF